MRQFIKFYRSWTHCRFVAAALLQVAPPSPREHDTSGTPSGNLFKFDSNVHLDSRIGWLDFGGQRSRSLWPRRTCFFFFLHLESHLLASAISRGRLEGNPSDLTQTFPWAQWRTDLIFSRRGSKVKLTVTLRPSHSCECDTPGTPGGTFPRIWHKRSLWLKDELITIWWSKVRGQGRFALIMTKYT